MLGGTFDDKAAALNPCTWRYGYGAMAQGIFS
jgi:hypothetical protein